MLPAIVFGGYGVFGSQVARALARRGVPVTLAGRDLAKGEALARELGPPARALAADVTRADSCRAAIKGHAVAASCAGPFSVLGTSLLDACLDEGVHYADIADDRAYCRVTRGYGPRFAARGLTAAWGCSSFPGISGALVAILREGHPADPSWTRLTLFIGNDNPKGEGAVRSAVSLLGRDIKAPQGIVRGFRDRAVVQLPPPFGRRAVYTYESPEYDLFSWETHVKVGFEMRAVTAAFAALALLGAHWGDRTARTLRFGSRFSPSFGHSGGAVLAEVAWKDGARRRASLSSPNDGQRMAALPCALAVQALCARTAGAPGGGAVTAYELLGARPMLQAITAEGFALEVA